MWKSSANNSDLSPDYLNGGWKNTIDTHREEGMKDQKKIRLGLIGVGNWALFAHVRVLRLLPEYEIVAIYSQRKEAAKAAATEYGIPHVAESLDALVRDPLVDAGRGRATP